MDQLLRHKEQLIATLRTLRDEYKTEYAGIPWGEQVFERVFRSAEKGKLLRGALVLFSAKEYGHEIDPTALRVAALMELAHTALLIHDDIMDQDEMRRGEKSLYMQFEEEAKHFNLRDSSQVGKALGLSAGDIVLIMIFQSINRLKRPYSSQLLQVMTHELMLCVFGQMQDVTHTKILFKDILDLYKNKTGRYSFALPLILGGILAGITDQEKEKMIMFGKAVGPLFQIADDKLGLTGTFEEIGKPVGSDIKEGKNTLYWYLLMNAISDKERENMTNLAGRTPSEKDIQKVISLLEKYGVNKKIALVEGDLEKEALSILDTLFITDNGKQVLRELLNFVRNRKS